MIATALFHRLAVTIESCTAAPIMVPIESTGDKRRLRARMHSPTGRLSEKMERRIEISPLPAQHTIDRACFSLWTLRKKGVTVITIPKFPQYVFLDFAMIIT